MRTSINHSGWLDPDVGFRYPLSWERTALADPCKANLVNPFCIISEINVCSLSLMVSLKDEYHTHTHMLYSIHTHTHTYTHKHTHTHTAMGTHTHTHAHSYVWKTRQLLLWKAANIVFKNDVEKISFQVRGTLP